MNEEPEEPYINCIQQMGIYETRARYYIVGSNVTQSKFRVLKIDRTEPSELIVIDDKVEYNLSEIKDMLMRIDLGNQGRSKNPSGSNSASTNTTSGTVKKPIASAHGIIGFIRLLEGYYIILITKRRKVAQIGHHTIYKVDDTQMIYIPNDGNSSVGGVGGNHKSSSAEERKYKKMFENIDLSSNFYFSYSYDLTRTLQYNLSPPQDDVTVDHSLADGYIWDSELRFNRQKNQENPEKLREKRVKFEDEKEGKEKNFDANKTSSAAKEDKESFVRRFKPLKRFIWNSYLLQNQDLHPEWQLNLIHGFVSQANIAVYGKAIFLTLIARRSSLFAGTRFLKRGANFQGDVANEVETEQIVFDSSISSFKKGRYTSFVQLRGSVPSHWSQDVSKMVPKPLITLDIVDPMFRTPGIHFNDLSKRYGSPICVLNLVKIREKRPHETVLSNEFIESIKYLNTFIPKQFAIKHIPFDMACFNKAKEHNVMIKLSDIAYKCLKKTGLFISYPTGVRETIRIDSPKSAENFSENSKKGQNSDVDEIFPKNYEIIEKPLIQGGYRTRQGRTYQTGTVRVNCVDCLDRTNTAQFALGRAALGLQLHVLGVLSEPYLEFETDTIRMLEELYEDHGDTLALQYGGSQLVHRIKTYRKIAPLSSHSRDIMQTLSRYYSNTFNDTDKQSAINVFLGKYKPYLRNTYAPSMDVPHIWELSSDYYLHNHLTPEVLWPKDSSKSSNVSKLGSTVSKVLSKPLTCWWDEEVAYSLPLPSNQVFKSSSDCIISIKEKSSNVSSGSEVALSNGDGYYEQYKPNEVTILDTTLYSHMLHTAKDFMPYFTTDYSPFKVRPIKRRKSIVQSSGLSLKSWFSSATSITPSAIAAADDINTVTPKQNMFGLYQASPSQRVTPNSSHSSFATSSFANSSPSESDEDDELVNNNNEFDYLDDANSLIEGDNDSESILSAKDGFLMVNNNQQLTYSPYKNLGGKLFNEVLVNNEVVYGSKLIKPLNSRDKHLYNHYLRTSAASSPAGDAYSSDAKTDANVSVSSEESTSAEEEEEDLFEEGKKIKPIASLNQNCYSIKLKQLSDSDKKLFETHVKKGSSFASIKINEKDMKMYNNYSNDFLFFKKY